MTAYSFCPGCGSAHIASRLVVKDYTVSQESFEIWECSDCSLRFTQNAPGQDAIGAYYQSDDYISHNDTNKGLINRLYHLVRKRTLRNKLKLVQRTTGLKRGRLLDIGAGTGAFLNTLKQAGWEVDGLEPEPAARKLALEKYGLVLSEPGALFEAEAQSYDAITLWHVLEHVHNLHGYLQQLNRLLKPGGRFFIAVPNYTSYDASVYREYWAAYDVPRHLYHFSPAAMKKITAQQGLSLDLMLPMWYDSFYVSMLSERYKRNKSGLPAAFFNGLLSDIVTVFKREKGSSLIYIGHKH